MLPKYHWFPTHLRQVAAMQNRRANWKPNYRETNEPTFSTQGPSQSRSFPQGGTRGPRYLTQKRPAVSPPPNKVVGGLICEMAAHVLPAQPLEGLAPGKRTQFLPAETRPRKGESCVCVHNPARPLLSDTQACCRCRSTSASTRGICMMTVL